MGVSLNLSTGEVIYSGDKIGGSTEFRGTHYDFSQSDFNYIGGTNLDGDFQINRYSKVEPMERTKAIGNWNDRYLLTYT